MVKISVIVPVYNTQKYLNECLNSLINQTFQDIEIICINDGSTDDSLEVLNEFSKKDNRIKIVTQKNSGLSASRNHGIELSKGEYIYFIDSDDYIELNTLKELYDISIENSCDLIIFKLINFYDDNYEKFTSTYYEMNFLEHFRNKLFNYKEVGDKFCDVAVSAPGKFFKKELIADLRFPEGLIFEDNLFFAKAIIKTKNIYFYDKHLYNRRIRKNSITQKFDIKYADVIIILNEIIELTKKSNLYEMYGRKLLEKKMGRIFVRFSEVSDEYKEEFFNLIKKDFENHKVEYENDSIFCNELDNRSKYIFYSALNSNSYMEFFYKIQLFDSKNKLNRLEKDNEHLKKKISNLNKSNDQIFSSRSWKITKPLRAFTNLFR